MPSSESSTYSSSEEVEFRSLYDQNSKKVHMSKKVIIFIPHVVYIVRLDYKNNNNRKQQQQQ